jgi:hypothetical protein
VRGARQPFRTTQSCSFDLLIVGAIRLQDELPQTVLCSGISDGAEQEETAPLPVGGELARGERDVLPRSILSRPDGESDQPQAIELAAGEVQFGIREFARRHVTIADDLHERVHGAISLRARRRAGDVSECVGPDRAPSMHLPVGGHRESVPQPPLQRVSTEEEWIGGCEQVAAFAIARLLEL